MSPMYPGFLYCTESITNYYESMDLLTVSDDSKMTDRSYEIPSTDMVLSTTIQYTTY